MTTEQRFWAKVSMVDTPNGCWLWTASKRNKGYGAFSYSVNGVMIQDRAHRYSWRIHNGEISEGLMVLHTCDTPACVNPKHLFLGTNNDNVQDMMQKGRHRSGGTYLRKEGIKLIGDYERGEKHHAAKLDIEKIRQIRSSRAEGESFGSISRRFGIAVGHIFRIANGKAWKHVE